MRMFARLELFAAAASPRSPVTFAQGSTTSDGVFERRTRGAKLCYEVFAAQAAYECAAPRLPAYSSG